MRRHAKASTAGSTQRQANRLGRFFGLACLAIPALIALLGSGASSAIAAEECPNEIRRQEQGIFALRLPDCRAYENVSPGSSPQTYTDGKATGIRVAADGDAVGYASVYPALGEETSGQFYLAERTASGWTRRNVVPQESPNTRITPGCMPQAMFSEELSKSMLEWGLNNFGKLLSSGEGYLGWCNENGEPHRVLDPREVPEYRNVFSHDLASDAYDLVSLDEAEGTPGESHFAAGSRDFGTIAIESEAQLTANAPGVTPGVDGGWNTFVWSGGVLRLATILPDGTPVQAAFSNSTPNSALARRLHSANQPAEFSNVISDDGSKLFFVYAGAIYMRVNPAKSQSAISGGECTEPAKACTVRVDESQGPDTSNGSIVNFITADGSKVFFTSDDKLTPDSTAVAGKEDLYEFDTESGDLADVTVNASEPADVWAVSDASADGSYVYFVAEAVLEGSGATTNGDCAHYFETSTCNLYVRHDGENHYIAALPVDDTQVFFGQRFLPPDYAGQPLEHNGNSALLRAESSPEGLFFAFVSAKSIAGKGEGIYVYDAVAEELRCVTCGEGGKFDEFNPGIAPEASFESSPTRWRRNQVLDDGSVLFTTRGPLVAADTNEANDVYRYKSGEISLISSGVVAGSSVFLGATPDGSDIYFVTPAGLIPSDTDGAFNLYDARVGGGFPEPPPLPGCEGEACRSAGTVASAAGATGSAAFKGAGNQAQHHKRDCGIAAKRAQKLARAAKGLRRQANSTNDAKLAQQLRQRSAKLAKQGRGLSKSAKRCRRANRGAGK